MTTGASVKPKISSLQRHCIYILYDALLVNKLYLPFPIINKNARLPKEAHIARNLKEIKMVDRAGEDLTDLDQHHRF